MLENSLISLEDPVLVTGASGFIGSKVVETLLSYGFTNVRCLLRPSSDVRQIVATAGTRVEERLRVVRGNMLSRPDCDRASDGVALVYNLVAGMEKSFPGCFMNSVLTLRNLLDSNSGNSHLKRIVHVSSFAVYSNIALRHGALLDEHCPLEDKFMERGEAYCYGKVKQEELLREYGEKHGTPYVIVRPGVPYGPRVKSPIHSRVGIDTFGIFLHLGRSNRLPLTHIDNCADAIVLAGLAKGIDGEAFNIVDDDLPTAREFLRLYKKYVHAFRSVTVPYTLFYAFCHFWENYSRWSGGQFPPAFNRRKCSALWKANTYSNAKLKNMVGWKPKISFRIAGQSYFDYLRTAKGHKQ